MKNSMGLRKRHLPHKQLFYCICSWKDDRTDSATWCWQMHTGQISQGSEDTNNPSWPCPAPPGASPHAAPSPLWECQFPALSLSPGWTSWPYPIDPLLASSPFAPSLAPGGVPVLVHHLPCQGLPMDPLTRPRLRPPRSASAGVCINGESTACAASPSAPVSNPSWGSLSLSSPSYSSLRMSVTWGRTPPHQALILLGIFQAMPCSINFGTKIMFLSKNIY